MGCKYDPVTTLACLASERAYVRTCTDDAQCFSDPVTDAQAVMVKSTIPGDTGATVFVAFRGSTSASDWIGNALVPLVRVPGHGRRVRAHAGFVRQYVSLHATIQAALEREGDAMSAVVFCGHSLGGALACIASSMWTGTAPCKLITFGAPRAGNHAFVRAVRCRTSGDATRVVHDLDIVPTTPMRMMGYTHVVEPWLCVDHDGYVHTEAKERSMVDEAILRVWGVIAADFGVSDHFMSKYLAAVPANAVPSNAVTANGSSEPPVDGNQDEHGVAPDPDDRTRPDEATEPNGGEAGGDVAHEDETPTSNEPGSTTQAEPAASESERPAEDSTTTPEEPTPASEETGQPEPAQEEPSQEPATRKPRAMAKKPRAPRAL